jgi:hypothetical protein
MSNLRIIGLIVGVVGLIVTFVLYRGPKWKRSNFVFLSFFNLFLIIVNINPNSVNFLRDLLSLQAYQYGRLIALLIISNIFLTFFLLYTKSGVENSRLQFDKLIRNLVAEQVKNSIELKKKIKSIMILIPAFNEATNLRDLLPKIPDQINNTGVGLLVVDDGSDDETKQVVKEHGHLVVSNLINRGGGAALRVGYDILKMSAVDICVTMDADGQHRPEEIGELVLPILDDRYDFVIGSRILGHREKGSRVRMMGVYFFSKIISVLLGKKITDPSSGYRAFRMEAMASINLYEDQYHTSELIIEAIKKGVRIGEVPITILKRKFGKSKKGKDWVYGLNFAKTIMRAWWR